jgi:peptide-methionine (S)-S-oxide reductase
MENLATFGGGCFWCTEAVFQLVKGVLSVESGYAGGKDPEPTYEAVCSGRTGHAEVVQLRFDPAQVRYEELLEVFFGTHDPTTVNRQGNDVGTQYRSVVFYHDLAQQKIAEDVKRRLEAAGVYDDPIVTAIVPFERFHKAEAYHQSYYRRSPGQGYCVAIIGPKLAKLKQAFGRLTTA